MKTRKGTKKLGKDGDIFMEKSRKKSFFLLNQRLLVPLVASVGTIQTV